MNMTSRQIKSSLKPEKQSIKTHIQKQMHPRELEKSWPAPVYVPLHPSEKYNDPDYRPTKAEKEHFEAWVKKTFDDVFITDDDRLPMPPKRDVEHEIPLIDKSDPPRPKRVYKVPDKLMEQWDDLHDKHVEAGLWKPTSSRNADPMMPVVKKDGKLRPVVDLRARNKNTVKLMMPTVDVDYIRTTLALYPFHLEADVKGAFQQLSILKSDVWKTAFLTIYGTYVTPVAQQGDTNSTVTLARMMNYILHGLVGKMLVTYADNIFGYARTWSDFWKVTSTIFHRCRIHDFYINANSVKICPPWVDVLGQRVRHLEIAMSDKQRDAILAMKAPIDTKGCQRFMGSVEWLSAFLPQLAVIAAPITELCSNAPFKWSTAQQLAFERVKETLEANRTLTVIKDELLAPPGTEPVHLERPPKNGKVRNNAHPGQYIFLQTDASETGIAGCLNVGTNWWTAKNVSNFSRKLTGSQYNYRVHELELLAVYQSFQKFEPRLIGREVIVITDNKSLQEFLNSTTHTPRQARVHEYLAQFKFKIKYINGSFNYIADMLSRQFEGENKETYFNSNEEDDHLKDLDDEPEAWKETLAAMDRPQRSRRLPVRFVDDSDAIPMPHLIPLDNVSNTATKSSSRAAIAKPKRKQANKGRKKVLKVPKSRVDKIILQREEVPDIVHLAPFAQDVDETYKDRFHSSMITAYKDDVDFSKIVNALNDWIHRYKVDSIGLLLANGFQLWKPIVYSKRYISRTSISRNYTRALS